jgi:hypothetical protein
MKPLRDMLTGKDNETHDFMRWLGMLGGLTALGLQIYAVVSKGQPFDMQAFGIGLGALVAGVGAALGMKKDTEP